MQQHAGDGWRRMRTNWIECGCERADFKVHADRHNTDKPNRSSWMSRYCCCCCCYSFWRRCCCCWRAVMPEAVEPDSRRKRWISKTAKGRIEIPDWTVDSLSSFLWFLCRAANFWHIFQFEIFFFLFFFFSKETSNEIKNNMIWFPTFDLLSSGWMASWMLWTVGGIDPGVSLCSGSVNIDSPWVESESPAFLDDSSEWWRSSRPPPAITDRVAGGKIVPSVDGKTLTFRWPYDKGSRGGASNDLDDAKKGRSDGLGVDVTLRVSISGPESDKSSNWSIQSSMSPASMSSGLRAPPVRSRSIIKPLSSSSSSTSFSNPCKSSVILNRFSKATNFCFKFLCWICF